MKVVDMDTFQMDDGYHQIKIIGASEESSLVTLLTEVGDQIPIPDQIFKATKKSFT